MTPRSGRDWSTSRSTFGTRRCRPGWPSHWLVRSSDLARYPDPHDAIAAVAARHGRDPAEVLPTAGAAQAFVLIAQALQPRHAVVVHPQFTEPEAALRAAGHDVHRVILPPPYLLDPDLVPDEADLVIVGNPTNPTSVAHPAGRDRVAGPTGPGPGRGRGLRRHRATRRSNSPAGPTCPGSSSFAVSPRPGRWPDCGWATCSPRPTLVGAARRRRSRCGRYRRRRSRRWSPARRRRRSPRSGRGPESLPADRAHLVAGLSALPGSSWPAVPASSFVLVRIPGAVAIRTALRERGFAVRRGDTFPGLGPDYLRVAVRDRATTDAFLAALPWYCSA